MAQNGVIPLAAFNTSVHYPFAVVQSLSHVHSLRSHRLQHAWPPCPSLSPRVCSNSCPLNQWCHPTILSSVKPFSSCPQSFPASGSFPMNWLLPSGSQSIRASASASVLLSNEYSGLISFRIDWFDLRIHFCQGCHAQSCTRAWQETLNEVKRPDGRRK